MGTRKERKLLGDNGGTRSSIERREYTSYLHIPERRSGKDRRCGDDRRKDLVPRGKNAAERREVLSQLQVRPSNETIESFRDD